MKAERHAEPPVGFAAPPMGFAAPPMVFAAPPMGSEEPPLGDPDDHEVMAPLSMRGHHEASPARGRGGDGQVVKRVMGWWSWGRSESETVIRQPSWCTLESVSSNRAGRT